MTRDLFRRYVWLVDTVHNGNKPTFDEIANAWLNSNLNDDGSALALRTFHNHREAIDQLFGLRILCDRSNHNRYYLAGGDDDDYTRLKIWMLQTLSLSSDMDASVIGKRVLLDNDPGERSCMLAVIDAMKMGKTVRIACAVPLADGSTEVEIAPYCVRYHNNGWYIFGKEMSSGNMISVDISRVLSLKITDTTFNYPTDFDLEGYFRNFYGVETDESMPLLPVRLKISGRSRDLVRTMPLHHSQKEEMAARDHSIFMVNLVPTGDFISRILSMGKECELVSPLSIREKVRGIIDSLFVRYSQ